MFREQLKKTSCVYPRQPFIVYGEATRAAVVCVRLI